MFNFVSLHYPFCSNDVSGLMMFSQPSVQRWFEWISGDKIKKKKNKSATLSNFVVISFSPKVAVAVAVVADDDDNNGSEVFNLKSRKKKKNQKKNYWKIKFLIIKNKGFYFNLFRVDFNLSNKLNFIGIVRGSWRI